MKTELKISDIFNITLDSISFTLYETINLSSNNFIVYVDNQKVMDNDLVLLKLNANSFTIKLNNKKILHSIIFFINTPLYYSDIFIYFSRLNLLGDDLNQLSFLKFIIPQELKSGNYKLQGFKYNDIFVSSNEYTLIIYNGISNTSTLKKVSSSSTDNIYEITLKDLSDNAIPDGIYQIEIHFK